MIFMESSLYGKGFRNAAGYHKYDTRCIVEVIVFVVADTSIGRNPNKEAEILDSTRQTSLCSA
jgi:hypothetical protein